MSYGAQAVVWIVGMALLGLALRPLVNRMGRERR